MEMMKRLLISVLILLALAISGCSWLTPTPTGPLLGESLTRPTDRMVMVSVPSGQFQTGRDGTDWHGAQVNAFWIDKTEVTDAQYRQCMAAGACDPPEYSHSGTEPYSVESDYGKHPVIFVNRGQAEAYCEWAGARLPTEDEWSYAARGPNSYTYPWGNTFDGTRLNYCDVNCPSGEADKNVNDGYASTAPVGSYPTGASWCGALDMSGNVWELTSEGVVLGGSWYSRAANARTGSGYDFGSGGLDYGFRCAADVSAAVFTDTYTGTTTPIPTYNPETESPRATDSNRTISILVDDFSPQPYQGESVYFFNRLEGDRGAINNSIMDWGNGQVTTTISQGNSWGGVWMSLNHPIREDLSINFSAILPPQILPEYQSQITGITVLITGGTPNRTFKLELKDGNELRWNHEIVLNGEQQVVSFDLPALGNINQFVWVLDHASEGDWVTLDSVSFTATTQVTDTATAAFVWSYGMLLNNWNPTTGLVRDKAKDASGEFDAIQATGSLAAATAIAEQLGVISHDDAIQIVSKIGDTLLTDLPRFHGLLPHWVKTSSSGEISIVENTEWSSVDTVIAAIGLLEAQSGLGMDASGTEQRNFSRIHLHRRSDTLCLGCFWRGKLAG
jgi:formylglycine-generating enzyme required for sulfatase activity